MDKAKIIIARDKDSYNIIVKGRATFECSSPIKSFADNIVSDVIQKITIDLKTCSWMDSTFMGTLAILGLHAKKADIIVNILNADEKNIKLLKEIGIYKLFIFDSNTSESTCSAWKNITCQANSNKQNVAKTVLEAHKTLMSVDEKNISKFKKVVELIKKDIVVNNDSN
jgi:anti-sigma B factor antagonist